VRDNQVTNTHLFTTKCLLDHGWTVYHMQCSLIRLLIADKILIRKQSNNCINAGSPSAEASFA